MTDAAPQLMTVAEFLEWDDSTDTRYELFDGRVAKMAPRDATHSVIAANLGGAVEAGLERLATAA